MSRERRFRKRVASTADADSSDGDDDGGTRLHEARAEQKKRQRPLGISSDSLTAGAAELDVLSRIPTAGKDADENLLASYVREEKRDTGTVDPEMEKYVESQMKQRLGLQSKRESDLPETQADRDERELYITPEDLKGQQISVTDGSAYMTGILEVPLGVDFKMRNIEDTEAAKRRLLSGTHGAQDEQEDDEDEARHSAQPRGGVHRVVYPRNFGRVSTKDADLRATQLRRYQAQSPPHERQRR